MSKYTVEFIENKPTGTGKERAIVTLKNEAGEYQKDITMWGSNWTNLAGILPGATLDGIIKPASDPKYGDTFYPGMAAKPASFKTSGIKEAQAVKRADIATAQDAKQQGIQISSTFGKATDITIAYFTGRSFTHEEFQAEWEYWRKWLNDSFIGDPIGV